MEAYESEVEYSYAQIELLKTKKCFSSFRII